MTGAPADATLARDDTAAVIIGRNEGARLIACLASVAGRARRLVYVDSGSTDGSVAAARAAGAEVVELDMSVPFTAARARNAGVAALGAAPALAYVQFVDGDCEVTAGWIAAAQRFLDSHPEVAAVTGQIRERHPEATFWNRLIVEEWKGEPGPVKACGGNAMMRLAAFRAAGGFDPGIIAGEEPELCVRLRMAGWKIWRLADEMVLHDVAMTRFGQWWQRCRRAGYTYAEGVAMHGRPPERLHVARLRRTLLWGLALPLAALAGLAVTPWAALLLAAWPLQIARLAARGMWPPAAAFLMLAKFAELHGAATWAWRRLRRGPARLLEYK
ncbi:Glycosyltransferase, GT2 family [Rhodovulum sp. ES.010]|uniref:glycosyltransferase n=1 Tax=Rhodovulum sp. ES.010 TaxID=1882821 RepID=UPI00092ADCA9|nr:glycosyltransferase family 2 protein [Rhodovulum sp. ES.010]SIO59839.1 Glycosyltransferase, GT2 family [Rhodovulum sp. ES.010]